MKKTGIAGKIAYFFINSKLTPLLIAAGLILGIFATFVTPREEEPQISVPMVDIFIPFPGASPKEVEDRITKVFEKKFWEIKGIEYVYSISKPSMSLIILRYKVGENLEESLVKLKNKIEANLDLLPAGSFKPIVKPKTIDDVPIMSLTFFSSENDRGELRLVASEVSDEVKKIDEVSEVTIIGGGKREFKVEFDPAKANAKGVSILEVIGLIQKVNYKLFSGKFNQNDKEFTVESGAFIEKLEDLENVVVGVYQGKPVYLKDVAEVKDGIHDADNYLLYSSKEGGEKVKGFVPAITISIAKRKGANATFVANEILKKIELLKGRIIPKSIEVKVTRNYGETAKEKSDELLKHMLIATISVTILIAIVLGIREACVAAVAIPVTLALTVLTFYLFGYTLNRVTLFALIFSIGILVDDAIVVVENIHRYFASSTLPPLASAISAVDEVGNPTILATFTVISAILPMAFVSGLMGPYMRPIPIGASMAMLFSLLAAFIITPWASFRFLKKEHKKDEEGQKEDFLSSFFKKWMRPLIEDKKFRVKFFITIVLLLALSISTVIFKFVTVKMLPFDNKSEIQVVIDMPEGSTLEATGKAANEMARYLRQLSEVSNLQVYIGTSSPFNFNGLVRHYYLREGSNLADIQVNLVKKDERKLKSHDIAKNIRPSLKAIADKYGAKVKVAEIPPGPPVLSTLIAEVYGPDDERRKEISYEILKIFDKTEGVVDSDIYIEDNQAKFNFKVDSVKASLNGVTAEDIAKVLNASVSGFSAGIVHGTRGKEPVLISVKIPIEKRSSIDDLKSIYLKSPSGKSIPLGELVKITEGFENRTLYRKNLKAVDYVIGDIAGKQESPVYAIFKMKEAVSNLKIKEGYGIKQYNATSPFDESVYSIKWDGEWHITYEVFRDLGIAFAAVLILIYFLVVAWFQSFTTPIVIMIPIALTLIGILPGHLIFGAFFTATSMIGMIALAGIIVRNSILLIDFIEIRLKEGMDIKQAVIEAGAVRFRPIVLTALAVIVGSFVILFDPIFQGMAIALMMGTVASTLLSQFAIPLLYYMVEKRKREKN